jgi:hypothetical protein
MLASGGAFRVICSLTFRCCPALDEPVIPTQGGRNWAETRNLAVKLKKRLLGLLTACLEKKVSVWISGKPSVIVPNGVQMWRNGPNLSG